MPNFSSGYALTNAGAKLMADVEAGKLTLKLTKMQLGSGQANTVDDYAVRSALFAPQNAMVITSITTEDVGNVRTCLLKASLTSESVETGYEATELGIFAQDSSGKEILYGVCYDSAPGYVPSKYDGNNVQINFAMRIITTSKAIVELVLPKTAEELVALTQEKATKAIESAESAATSASDAATSNSYAQLAMSKASGFAGDAAESAELARKAYEGTPSGKAKESELAAKASEEAAKTSETNAKSSEDAAAASAKAAAASQTAAKTSETNAQDYMERSEAVLATLNTKDGQLIVGSATQPTNGPHWIEPISDKSWTLAASKIVASKEKPDDAHAIWIEMLEQ